MAGVRVKENEPIEVAIRRFKKQCEKAGILSELRKREHFEKPSVRKQEEGIGGQEAISAPHAARRRLSEPNAGSGSQEAAGMNGIDVALVVLLLVCGLRGSWRGIFRESFGFAGLVLGLLAAAARCRSGSQPSVGRTPGRRS